MSRINRGNNFLGGFASTNYLEDYHMGKKYEKTPVANIAENDKFYLIELGIPGYKKSELNLTVNESNLVVSGVSKIESGEDSSNNMYTTREFDYSTFQRKFELPDDIRSEEISASYDEGMLKITLPKSPAGNSKNKIINIQ